MKKIKINKEYFSRLFVICKQNKMNLKSFSKILVKQDLLILSENENEVISLKDLFFELTGIYIEKDNSFGIFDDAYWCGTVYFYLHFKTRKSLSYISLKFPLDKLINSYNVYHEMDYSSILEKFLEVEKENSILSLLCLQKGCSLTDVNRNTSINYETLKKLKKNDKNLYSTSFKNIFLLQNYFDVNYSLFI